MAVDFNAEPSPEGLARVAELRRQRAERDKALEDRIAAVQLQDLEAAGAHPQPASTPVEAAVDDEVERDEPDQDQSREYIGGLTSARENTPSPTAQLEALASLSRARSTDRQR